MAFCSKCGAELPADAQFCSKCGQPAAGAGQGAGGPSQSPPYYGMSRHEMRHQYRQMRRAARWGHWASPEWALLNTIFAGLIVVLLGSLLYLAAAGVTDLVTWSNFWAYFLLGIGILLIVRSLFAMLARHYFGYGGVIAGLVLVVIGATGVATFLSDWQQYLWIGIIVAIGVIIIVSGFATYLFRRP